MSKTTTYFSAFPAVPYGSPWYDMAARAADDINRQAGACGRDMECDILEAISQCDPDIGAHLAVGEEICDDEEAL